MVAMAAVAVVTQEEEVVTEHQAVAVVLAMAAVVVVTQEEEVVTEHQAVAAVLVSAAQVPAVGKIAATATVIQLQPQLLPQIPGVLRPLTLVGVNPAVMVSMMAVAAAVAEGIAPPAQHPVKIGAITAALRVNYKPRSSN